MGTAYINRMATAVPANDFHAGFTRFVEARLADAPRRRAAFARMSARSGIEHRYSVLPSANGAAENQLDGLGFYVAGRFPSTAERMRLFAAHASDLAVAAFERLGLGAEKDRITHLIVTCCTGFSAPGVDLELVERCGLPRSVERTSVGFMGCHAAINALKLARNIVRAERAARVLVVNVELCTLHLQETDDLERLLMFLLWGDGCAASLVTAEPQGIAIESFRGLVLPDTAELMKWQIGNSGFDMLLSGRVPAAISETLRTHGSEILEGMSAADIDLWAVHPGGRTVLDAVEQALCLPPSALSASREILRRFGNMSSATVMFVLETLLRSTKKRALGCAMAFGPGLSAETMLFRTVPNQLPADDRPSVRSRDRHELVA